MAVVAARTAIAWRAHQRAAAAASRALVSRSGSASDLLSYATRPCSSFQEPPNLCLPLWFGRNRITLSSKRSKFGASAVFEVRNIRSAKSTHFRPLVRPTRAKAPPEPRRSQSLAGAPKTNQETLARLCRRKQRLPFTVYRLPLGAAFTALAIVSAERKRAKRSTLASSWLANRTHCRASRAVLAADASQPYTYTRLLRHSRRRTESSELTRRSEVSGD